MALPAGSQQKSETWASERAQAIALDALGYLAADPERIEAFLSLSGLDPANLRAAAAQPGFLAGVLDHLATDERLLVAFAASAGLNPADVERARQLLAGPPGEWSA